MKKNKLEEGYEIDFELIGIVCNKKEYKLAWYLNQALKINLVKQNDIRMEFLNNAAILISNLKFETELLTFELLQNRLLEQDSHKKYFLIPELKRFDYFLKFKDQTRELSAKNLNLMIKEISIIEYAMQLNFDSLKSKENFLY